MTPALRTDSPRTPGCLDGRPLPCYGAAGDVCAVDGCGTRLSAYNPRDTCNRHGGGRPRSRRCAVPEPPFDDAPGFMEPARHPTREELEMAAEKRREAVELILRLRTFAASKGSTWFTSTQAQVYAECSNSAARRHLGELVKSGVLESSARRGYRLRQDAAAKAAEQCDKPDHNIAAKVTPDVAPDPSPASAPETDREQPADEAAASVPEPPSPGPRPFAGITVTSVQFLHDREVYILQLLDELDDDRRERVLQYAVSKWWLK